MNRSPCSGGVRGGGGVGEGGFRLTRINIQQNPGLKLRGGGRQIQGVWSASGPRVSVKTVASVAGSTNTWRGGGTNHYKKPLDRVGRRRPNPKQRTTKPGITSKETGQVARPK